MKSGALRHRVEIQAFDYVTDSAGNAIQNSSTGEVMRAWSHVADAWAEIRPVSGREFIESKAVQSEITTRIKMRYRADVAPSNRVIHGSRTYHIEAVMPDPDSGLEYLTLLCSIGVTEGAA